MSFESKYVFKVVFVGDAAVGKTSLIAKHVSSSFRANYIPTIGANVTSRDYNVKGQLLTLMIWDVAAQEGFNEVRMDYYKGARAAFVVYDVTRPDTYADVMFWINDLKKSVPKKIPILLVGNKIDLPAATDRKAVERLAEDLGIDYILTSAKTGHNVEQAFQKVSQKVFQTIPVLKTHKKLK